MEGWTAWKYNENSCAGRDRLDSSSCNIPLVTVVYSLSSVYLVPSCRSYRVIMQGVETLSLPYDCRDTVLSCQAAQNVLTEKISF